MHLVSRASLAIHICSGTVSSKTSKRKQVYLVAKSDSKFKSTNNFTVAYSVFSDVMTSVEKQ